MIIIQKFGGTSVGSKQRIKSLKNIIKFYKINKIKTVIILSAMSGETTKMLHLAKYFYYKKLKELDCLLCIGEQMSVSLFSILLNSIKIKSKPLTSGQIGLLTNNDYSFARILCIKNFFLIKKIINKDKIPILAGFQGITISGNYTTLGRGGSDTTAIAISAYLNAKECQIYTDVDSVYITDPRICYNKKIKYFFFESILELSSLGSKVLYVRSVEIARKYNVNIRVLSSFIKNNGTLIFKKKFFSNSMERSLISGITHSNNEVKITIYNIINIPGIASKIFGPIISSGICIDILLTNSFKKKYTNITFLVENKFLKKIIFILNKFILTKIGGNIYFLKKIVKISIIGIGLRNNNKIIDKMFFILSKNKINIILTYISENRVSILINDFNTLISIKSIYNIFNKYNLFRRNG